MHRAKQFKWEGNSLLWMWVDEQVKVVPHLKQCESLVRHVMKSWAILGFDKYTICYKHSTSGEGCNYKFNNLILGVWCVIEFRHLLMHLHFNYYHYHL